MTRFLYIADTHLGVRAPTYYQQEPSPDRLPQILAALCEHETVRGGVDFILHGGDIVHEYSVDNIAAAVDAFRIDIPVYLCLGNHDLTAPQAADQWLKQAPGFFGSDAPEFTITSDDCMVHVVPNHWGEVPYCSEGAQGPHLSDSQLDRVTSELHRSPDLPHILLTHSQVYGLPTAQTGLDEPYHSPAPSFTAQVATVAARYPALQCVLGAHNHMNMCVHENGTAFVTVSALTETPYEFKLFEVSPNHIEMSTIPLQPALGFDGDYDTSKSYVQGRPVDRAFSKSFDLSGESS